MAEIDDDPFMRRTLERELRRRKIYQRGDHLLAAWNVDLLSLKINHVEVEERERDRRWVRALRHVVDRDAPSALGLSTRQVLLRTPRGLYASMARLTYLARSDQSVVELMWVTQRPDEGSPAADAIPHLDEGPRTFVTFTARVDALSSARAKEIVEQITERRTWFLAQDDPETRAKGERLIASAAEVKID